MECLGELRRLITTTLTPQGENIDLAAKTVFLQETYFLRVISSLLIQHKEKRGSPGEALSSPTVLCGSGCTVWKATLAPSLNG